MENLLYFPFIFLTYIFEWSENKLEDDESLEYPDIYIEPTENIFILCTPNTSKTISLPC